MIRPISSSRRDFVKTGITAALAGASTATAGSSSAIARPEDSSSTRKGGELPRVIVHSEGHFLSGVDGSPFFWLGDTAWQLIQGTSRDECTYYLQARARQGFTVILTVVLSEMGGVREPTATGLLPFADMDPRQPNEAYFDRIIEIVGEAEKLGLYVALLPAWGDKLTAPWGSGPRLFRNDNLDVAAQYASYLAGKLKKCANVLWILGGRKAIT
jgi:hypothetical protein